MMAVVGGKRVLKEGRREAARTGGPEKINIGGVCWVRRKRRRSTREWKNGLLGLWLKFSGRTQKLCGAPLLELASFA